jgi:hypothetical protein
VSAVGTENSVTCARVDINIDGKSNLKMVTADEISEALWPERSGIQPVGKKVPDFNLFIDKLKKLNWSYEDVSGNKNAITTRVDGVHQIWLQDPDGYWLEINDDTY